MATFNYITPEGITVPDAAEVLRETQAEYQGIFGGDLVLDPGTPEARFIDAETLARLAVVRDLGGVVNQINPEFSEGQFLDTLVKISGLPDAPEIVGPNKPEGLGSAIRVTPEVPRTAPDNITRNYFRSTIRPQRDSAMVRMQREILALNSVRSVLVRENISTSTSSTSPDSPSFVSTDFTIDRNSVFILVQFIPSIPGFGEPDPENLRRDALQAVARVALNTRTVGPRFVNANPVPSNPTPPDFTDPPVSITDEISGSSYEVILNFPSELRFDVRFSAFSESAVLGSDLRPFVRSAINDYANGLLPSESGFTIDRDILPFELAAAVNARFPEIFIQNLEVRTTFPQGDFSLDTLGVNDTQIAALNTEDSGVIQV